MLPLRSNFARSCGSPSTNANQWTSQNTNRAYHNFNLNNDFINRNTHQFYVPPPPRNYTYIPLSYNYYNSNGYTYCDTRRAPGAFPLFFILCTIATIFLFAVMKR